MIHKNFIERFNDLLETLSPDDKKMLFINFDLKGKENYYLHLSQLDKDLFALYYDDEFGDECELLELTLNDLKDLFR